MIFTSFPKQKYLVVFAHGVITPLIVVLSFVVIVAILVFTIVDNFFQFLIELHKGAIANMHLSKYGRRLLLLRLHDQSSKDTSCCCT
jgi:hypothetical protein